MPLPLLLYPKPVRVCDNCAERDPVMGGSSSAPAAAYSSAVLQSVPSEEEQAERQRIKEEEEARARQERMAAGGHPSVGAKLLAGIFGGGHNSEANPDVSDEDAYKTERIQQNQRRQDLTGNMKAKYGRKQSANAD